MIKLIALCLGIWMLWGYDLFPPFSLIRQVAMPVIEKVEAYKEDWVVLRAQETEPSKRKRRW